MNAPIFFSERGERAAAIFDSIILINPKPGRSQDYFQSILTLGKKRLLLVQLSTLAYVVISIYT